MQKQDLMIYTVPIVRDFFGAKIVDGYQF